MVLTQPGLGIMVRARQYNAISLLVFRNSFSLVIRVFPVILAEHCMFISYKHTVFCYLNSIHLPN